MNEQTRNPNLFLVDSVEKGVKIVKESLHVAVMAGRETLFFDIQRFGPQNFHLSEKLNTAYSAIALQLGCPYKENFNKILMGIFEAGILTKMTEDEYENLGKQQVDDTETEQAEIDEVLLPGNLKENRKAAKANEDNEKLRPINIRMLQGAFYLLAIGHTVSGLVMVFEILYHRHDNIYKRKHKKRFICFGKVRKKVNFWTTRAINSLRRRYRELMNEAIVATLEYTE